jgi:hypothetical protein
MSIERLPEPDLPWEPDPPLTESSGALGQPPNVPPGIVATGELPDPDPAPSVYRRRLATTSRIARAILGAPLLGLVPVLIYMGVPVAAAVTQAIAAVLLLYAAGAGESAGTTLRRRRRWARRRLRSWHRVRAARHRALHEPRMV